MNHMVQYATAQLDASLAALSDSTRRGVLEQLGPANRLALTLRYLDGLSIPEMARELGRSRHATEALVVRARAAFRRAYEGEEA